LTGSRIDLFLKSTLISFSFKNVCILLIGIYLSERVPQLPPNTHLKIFATQFVIANNYRYGKG
jgi:hypothetical protein